LYSLRLILLVILGVSTRIKGKWKRGTENQEEGEREREMGDGDRDVLGIEKGTLGCKDDK
jgi:hypothetical protein